MQDGGTVWNTYTAVFQHTDDWWVGYVEEVPGALAQERTLEEARASLTEALRDVLEANREVSRRDGAAGEPVIERIVVPAS